MIETLVVRSVRCLFGLGIGMTENGSFVLVFSTLFCFSMLFVFLGCSGRVSYSAKRRASAF